jgi:hypothetical protein
MYSSTLLVTLGQLATVLVADAGPSRMPDQVQEPKQFEAGRTGKERLGGKASDEQRVDNCNVPFDLRGPKPRPDDCGAGASTSTGR